VITFKEFLFESKELGVDAVRPLSAVEKKRAQAAAVVFTKAHELLELNKRSFTMEHVQEFRKVLEQYGKPFKFAQRMMADIDEMLGVHQKMVKSGEHLKTHMPAIKHHSGNLKAAFLSGDKEAMRKHKAELDKRLDDVDHNIDVAGNVQRRLERTFSESPSIFGTTRLLKNIGDTEYRHVKALNFDDQLYTTNDFPHGKTDEFDYVLHFLLQLNSSPKPRRVTDAGEFRISNKVRYANDGKFERLMKLTDQYLHSNDKELIPEIKALIDSVPEIKRANDKAKLKIKTVYRGIAIGENQSSSSVAIERQERKQRYVATSDSRHAAKNFALQKGHLESDENRRSELGVIITYSVTPAAILFDTRVVDTAYNESEILIDATKATIENIEEI
jgi:hypothetical protein